MLKILNYQIISGDLTSLSVKVNNFIYQGWQPFGAPVIDTSIDEDFLIIQAMVQYDNE